VILVAPEYLQFLTLKIFFLASDMDSSLTFKTFKLYLVNRAKIQIIYLLQIKCSVVMRSFPITLFS